MSTTNSLALDITTLAAECNKNAAAVGLCRIVDVSRVWSIIDIEQLRVNFKKYFFSLHTAYLPTFNLD